jgi:hypothetical protein
LQSKSHYRHLIVCILLIKKLLWLWSASELCRPSDRRVLAK